MRTPPIIFILFFFIVNLNKSDCQITIISDSLYSISYTKNNPFDLYDKSDLDNNILFQLQRRKIINFILGFSTYDGDSYQRFEDDYSLANIAGKYHFQSNYSKYTSCDYSLDKPLKKGVFIFDNLYSVNYISNDENNESKKDIKTIKGEDIQAKLFEFTSLKPIPYARIKCERKIIENNYIDTCEYHYVPTRIYFDSVKVFYFKGLTGIKIRNSKVHFYKHTPDKKIKDKLTTIYKYKENGYYRVEYEYGDIMGQNIWFSKATWDQDRIALNGAIFYSSLILGMLITLRFMQ